MLEQIFNSFNNIFSNPLKLFNDFLIGSVSQQQFIDLSVIVLTISFIFFVIGIIIFFVFAKKSREEKIASKLVLEINLMKTGKKKVLEEKVKSSNKIDVENQIKKGETSLKQLLIDKFKPLIEKQLKSKIDIIDFNARKENFVVKINVQGNKLELILDSSGQIVDYKRL